MSKEKILLLTYPRSGNCWTRYIMKEAGPEMDLLSIHTLPEKDYPEWRDAKMISIVRNYKESFLRNFYHTLSKLFKEYPTITKPTLKIFKEINVNAARMNTIENYVDNLKVFDEWENEKLLLSYEKNDALS